MPTPETATDERRARRSRHRPPVARHHVARPRIDAALDDAQAGALGIVCAAAGSGKTEALAGWVERRGVGAGWLSLGREDNDPAVFWPALAGALEVPDPGTVRSAHQLVDRLRTPARPARPRTVVLDDYHVVVEQRIHAGLDVLLAAAVPDVHLLIGSRHDPPLRLSRLRAGGQLREIRLDQLRFDEHDAAGLLNGTMGLDLAEPDVAHLTARTEGWAAGLQLAGLALQGRPDRHAYVVDFAADDRHVADYVRDEVVAVLPDDLRRFVEETAILDRLCAPLCAAVTDALDPDPPGAGPGPGADADAAQAVLERLERMNLFLAPLDHRRRWYRYHQLFAEWLQLRPPPGAEQRHRRAARWLADHGRTGDAVGHFVQAKDVVAAADLVEARRWGLVGQGRQHTLQQWIRALPADLTRARPHLRLAEAWIAYHEGRWSAVQDLARSVSGTASRESTAAPDDAVLAEALCLMAGSHMALGRADEAGATARRALSRLPAGHGHIGSSVWLILGKSHLAAGDLAGATAAFATARGLQPEVPIVALIAASHEAEIHRREGHPIEARELAGTALAVANEAGLDEHPECAVAHLVLARLHSEAGRADQAAVHLTRGTELAERIPYEPRRQMAAATRRRPAPTDLSTRELDVLRLLASPLSPPEIADALYVSINTLKTHTRAIYQKLGVNARHSAIEQARRLDLL